MKFNMFTKVLNSAVQQLCPSQTRKPADRFRRAGRFSLSPNVEGLEVREAPSTIVPSMLGFTATTNMIITITVTNEDDIDPDMDDPIPVEEPEETTDLGHLDNDMLEPEEVDSTYESDMYA